MNYLYSNDTETFLKEYNDSFADLIREKYVEMYNAEPGQYLYNSWKTSIAYIKNLALKLQNKGIVFEYIIPAGAERADAVLIGNLKSPSITLIEMKGWKTMNILDDYFVRADNKREVNPEYQVLNYEGKIRYSVDGINDYHINSMVILYNIKNIENRGKLTFLGNEQDRIIKELKNYLDPGYCSDDLKKFVTGKYRQNKNLFDAVRLYYNDIKEGAMRSLAVKGYGLFNEQLEPYSEIIDALSSGKTGNFVIHGGPGSGKTLIAMNLLLRSAAMGKQSVLSYRNNRMVESIRKMLDSIDSGLSTMVKYYSTGRPGNPGVADSGFNVHYDIAIFDEAQRMTTKNIINAGNVAKISVFFYDDSQILGRKEDGTRENFLKNLADPVEINLKGLYRNGNEYGEFVNNMLAGNPVKYPEYYDLRSLPLIDDLIQLLKQRVASGKKSALVASFTEAKGDKKDTDSIDNIRIGSNIPSGFGLYKNSNITIKWLMDPKKEYAPFWVDGKSNDLKQCASVYGAQGFEADYVGVIWGRDLVWRDNQWKLGDNCEDFEIKKLFNDGKNGNSSSYKRAIELLKNRYRILLTRGIHGTYIFCEDHETGEYIKSLCNL